MLDALKPLLDSDLVNDETRQEISEAWESKLNEAREQVRAELREEFAQRYEHDKSVMVEALDRMVTEGLAVELQQVQAEKSALAEDRVKFQAKMSESATKFNNFMVTKLAEEIGELRKDRKQHNEGMEKLESFVVHALAREIQEFAQDKRDVVETKVRLVREARAQLEALKVDLSQNLPVRCPMLLASISRLNSTNSKKISKLLARTILVVESLKHTLANLAPLISMRKPKYASCMTSLQTKMPSWLKPSNSPRKQKFSLNPKNARSA